MGPFIHQIDPVLASVGGIHLWWYGLSYALGFLGVHFWFRRRRWQLGMSLSEVYSISVYLMLGVLLGGRLLEVVFYEWDYYGRHPFYIPAYWLGGMATHGLLLGGGLGTLLYCRRYRRSFLAIADELVIATAWVMGIGRLGNFIDGQIAGSLSNAWWAVQFPDLAGFRHPVVLYDGLKNLLLIPLLIWIARQRPPTGVVFAQFVFWYAFLRIFVDLFREYRVESLGIGTGQVINLAMAAFGLLLTVWFYRRDRQRNAVPVSAANGAEQGDVPLLKRGLFAGLLLFCLTMPSDWTQDVPARYGSRHEGLAYSLLYPPIAERAPIQP